VITETADPTQTVEQPGQNLEPDIPVADAVAVINGTPLPKAPEDLYIPPDALEVFLETFEGPLDLLLYLIRKQNLEILDIPIALVTRQYMEYIGLMESLRLELAAEYLLMAAILAEIKSRMLLPRPVSEEDEGDPRAELIRRLQEYEVFREAAQELEELPRMERNVFPMNAESDHLERPRIEPQVEIRELLLAMATVMARAEQFAHHTIQREQLSVRERMSMVLDRVVADHFVEFTRLFRVEEGRMGVVVTLLAVLELTRESLIELTQNEAFGPIYIRARA
jgi:segregation and condensation protein A